MVDRQQEQARQLAESLESAGGAGRDLAWILGASVLVVAAAALSGIADRVQEAATDLSSGTTMLIGILLVVPIAAGVFSVRRHQAATRARTALRDLSRIDPLTGLPNRAFLGEDFEEMARAVRRFNGRLAVFFIDLDGFKRINDTHGHDLGDTAMRTLATRLIGAVGLNDRVVRYGGDEFVVIAPEIPNATAAERLAGKILRAIEAPVEIEGDILRISASVGIALSEPRPNRPDEILRDADAAMYRAKAAGAGTYALFDRSLRDQITPSTAERRLRQALSDGEFRLYYQPIVSLYTKRLVGAEALLRWSDPERGLVSPGEFMPALEDTGLIIPVGNWVVTEVCRQSRAWQDRYPDRPPLNIKVNVSVRQFAQANFVDHLRDTLGATGADPARICLEITEGALTFDPTSADATLAAVKQLGVSLALDDFGTGYSSLSYLRQYPLDLIKIDKSFIDGVGFSREDTLIIEHVVAMAKALGIVTVAEGVENETQAETLREIGCDLAQGYYFSHPQPPDVIAKLMEANANRQEWRPPERTEAVPEGDAAAVVSIPERAATGADEDEDEDDEDEGIDLLSRLPLKDRGEARR